MKKLISLTVLLVVLCAMTVCPVAFASEATGFDAYKWIELGQASSTGDVFGSGFDWSYKYKADGTQCTDRDDAANAVALRVGRNGYLALRSVDFGTTAPTSIIFNVLVEVPADTTVRVYALPVGSAVNTVSNGVITSLTLPAAEGEESDATTDATAIEGYKIGEWKRQPGQYSHYDVERGASGYYKYEYKLDSTKAAALIKAEATSNPYMIVMCGSQDRGLPVIRNVKFASNNTLDAFAMQSTWYNAARTNIAESESRTGVNNALVQGESASDYSAYMIYKNVDFGETAARNIAVSLFYSKGTGFYDGDIAVEVDINKDGVFDADERFAQITTVDTTTNSGGTFPGTSHYALLSENITGVHDVRINFLDPYIARLHNVRFNVVDPETDVYGDVTVTKDEGATTYSVNMPIRKEYIKGAGEIIVALYNADSEGNPTSLSKLTPGNFEIITNDNTDYGWDTTSATITFNASDIEGKVVKAFLWKDMDTLVPLSAASATDGVVAAQ